MFHNKVINSAVLLSGSNLGNRVEYLTFAQLELLQAGASILKASALYESEAWGFESSAFVNQVLIVETELSSDQLLQLLQVIEKKAGRKRTLTSGYAARTLDLDILFFNNQIIETADLTIPHPRLHERRFTLMPLHEIMPQYKHPVLQQTVETMLAKCPDTGKVEPFIAAL
jgi:2-amino-4-hydroxy-6-hydroxymethyldihydropteridine diphosphokinase